MDEKLQDIISIISLLETDMEQEKVAEVYMMSSIFYGEIKEDKLQTWSENSKKRKMGFV